MPLTDPEIGLGDQSKITTHGFAIQCRVTTEDPANNFVPDYGRLDRYRSAGGMGIRLDAGTAFTGAVITPFYDSLLVKVTAQRAAVRRRGPADGALPAGVPRPRREDEHPVPAQPGRRTRSSWPARRRRGSSTRRPSCSSFPSRRDRATKLLAYIAEVIVNGHPEVKDEARRRERTPRPAPSCRHRRRQPADCPQGTRDLLHELGPEKFAEWVREQKRLLITDTTIRDAHQSLLATRMRTVRHAAHRPTLRPTHTPTCSRWRCGAGRRSTRRCGSSRSRPGTGSPTARAASRTSCSRCCCGRPTPSATRTTRTTSSRRSSRSRPQAGIDLFRIFDALNWLPNLQLGDRGGPRTRRRICEAAICYTGDILDPKRDKYILKYYVDLAKELEKLGTHILAIKDMAGLCKPYAAKKLVQALRQEVGLPIHFHTHDSAGGQIASYLMAAEEGVDIVDCAFAPLAGLTSQPSLNALVEALRFTDRDTGMSFDELQTTADYWEDVRQVLRPVRDRASWPRRPTSTCTRCPAGSTRTCIQQAQSLGLGDRWHEVGRMYAEVNQLFGDIVKVTPTSKVVGDMALFMVANNLTPEDVLDPKRELAFPESVVEFFEGRLGQPPGGFPEGAAEAGPARPQAADATGPARRCRRPTSTRAATELEKKLGRTADRPGRGRRTCSTRRCSPTSSSTSGSTPTRASCRRRSFFYGMEPGEEVSVDIEPGKTLIIKFLTVGDPHEDGKRLVFFELNGQPREVLVVDRSLAAEARGPRPKAEPGNPLHVAAPMPGPWSRCAVGVGEQVAAGQKLLTLEAMKMETTLYAERRDGWPRCWSGRARRSRRATC